MSKLPYYNLLCVPCFVENNAFNMQKVLPLNRKVQGERRVKGRKFVVLSKKFGRINTNLSSEVHVSLPTSKFGYGRRQSPEPNFLVWGRW